MDRALSWRGGILALLAVAVVLGLGLVLWSGPGWRAPVVDVSDQPAAPGRVLDCTVLQAEALQHDWPRVEVAAPDGGWSGRPVAVVVWGPPNGRALFDDGGRVVCGSMADSRQRDSRFNAGIGTVLTPAQGSGLPLQVSVPPSMSLLWPTRISVGEPARLQRADGVRWMLRVGVFAVALVLLVAGALAFAASRPRNLVTLILSTSVFALWVAEATGIAGYPTRWLVPEAWQVLVLILVPLPVVAAAARGLLMQTRSYRKWPQVDVVTRGVLIGAVAAAVPLAFLSRPWLEQTVVAIELATLLIVAAALGCALALRHRPRELAAIAIAVLPFGLVVAGSLAASDWLLGWKVEAITVASGWMVLIVHLLAARRMGLANRDLRAMRLLASTDELTGVPNRRATLRSLTLSHELAVAHGAVLAVAVIDLDHFKRLNDSHGHAFGDQALVHFTTSVRACIRRSDIIGRTGGEEFVLVLPDASLAQAAEIIEKIRARLAQPAVIEDTQVVLEFSAGLVDAIRFGSAEDAIVAADRALYRAKAAGRGCSVVAAD